MSLIQKILRQYRMFKPSVATRNMLYGWTERERRKSYGPENADEQFYIIRCINSRSPYYTGPIFNLLANHSYVLSHLHYAYERGYLPLIDQLHYPVYNSQTQPVNGTLNPWEFFWEQPGGYTLEEAYRSKHVILSQRNWISEWNLGYDIPRHKDPEVIRHLHDLAERAPLNAVTKAYVDNRWQDSLACAGRVLGVSYRFAGHAKSSPHRAPDHPIQPEVESLLAAVQERCEAWGMDAVFLATESDDAVERFRNALGSRLVVLSRVRQRENVAYSKEQPNPMYAQGAMYQTSLDYLAEMELLARCTALMGSLTSGLRYAIIRNNAAYEHLDILDYGRFADPRRKTAAKELHS